MIFDEMSLEHGKTLLLLPGTCCNYETNFGAVLDELKKHYHLICVNYDGFDGSDQVFPDMITVTEKIEAYIKQEHNGRVDGALGSSLGGSFVGQLIMRKNVHVDHGIFGSSDLDQSGVFAAKLQTKLMYPIIASAAKKSGKQGMMRKILVKTFQMSDETADKFMACFAQFKPESILNEYYTDLITCLDEDIQVSHTQTHFIYANQMGKKYEKRYRKYFHNPDIHEFNMQHEQWLFGDNGWTKPVLETIYECMEMPV